MTLKNPSLEVFSKCICHRHCLCICLSCCLFVRQVMFPHHSDQIPQRSKYSKIALWRLSLNVFVIVFVIVFVSVFAFVIIFVFVRSCFLITLFKCLKGQTSQRLLFLWVRSILLCLKHCIPKEFKSLASFPLKCSLS